MDKKKRRIEMIPIDRINFLNPRVRNQKIFNDIAHNITQVGLKRPITVTPCVSKTPDKDYDLVCGQGRLETFMACGRKEIPAIIVEVTEEEALLMSLAENMARLQRRPLELLQGIELLKKKGYSGAKIAEKTGMTPSYVSDILKLLEHGEERLVVAVENGHMPIRLALDIATAPDDEQRALQEAYESKQLRGNRFLMAKRLLEARRRRGKSLNGRGSGGHGAGRGKITVNEILRIYQKEVDRKTLLARKADLAGTTLTVVIAAMRQLLKEEHFLTLLRAEKLSTMPAPIQELLKARG